MKKQHVLLLFLLVNVTFVANADDEWGGYFHHIHYHASI